MVEAIFLYSELGKNLKLIDHWEASGRIQAGAVASRFSRGPDGKWTSSGRMMLGLTGVRTVWYVVRTDGTVVRWASRRDGTIVRMAGRELKTSVLKAVQNLLTSLWIVESLIKQHLYKQVILSKHKMRPIILTIAVLVIRDAEENGQYEQYLITSTAGTPGLGKKGWDHSPFEGD
jgi:hypothetical protein